MFCLIKWELLCPGLPPIRAFPLGQVPPMFGAFRWQMHSSEHQVAMNPRWLAARRMGPIGAGQLPHPPIDRTKGIGEWNLPENIWNLANWHNINSLHCITNHFFVLLRWPPIGQKGELFVQFKDGIQSFALGTSLHQIGRPPFGSENLVKRRFGG